MDFGAEDTDRLTPLKDDKPKIHKFDKYRAQSSSLAMLAKKHFTNWQKRAIII